MRLSVERPVVALVATTTPAVVVAQGVAAILATLFPEYGPGNALHLTAAVIGVGLLSLAVWPRAMRFQPAFWAGLLLSSAAAALLGALNGGLSAACVAIFLVGPAQVVGALVTARFLPGNLDGAFQRRCVVSMLWGVLGLMTIVQTARISTFMADSSMLSCSILPFDSFYDTHMCQSAYVYAADLHGQGEENIYDAALYPLLSPGAQKRATVENLDRYVDDPFQYPPPFLLLPRAGLVVTNDYLTLRTAWFVVQALGFALVLVLVALWVKDACGMSPAFLIPAVWLSFPAMMNLQQGQFHLAMILLAVAALLAFETRRLALGGGLMAAAILSKISPGILLVPLLVQRRWRAVAWTVTWAVALTLLSWVVFGPAPFRAFVQYHLPRMQSGEAFSFALPPDERLYLNMWNQSVFGLVHKFADLGVPGMTLGLARCVSWGYSIALLGLAVVAARRMHSRLYGAQVWLALLNLAAMRSPYAGDYSIVGNVWLLALLTTRMRGHKGRSLFLGACWCVAFLFPLQLYGLSFPYPTIMSIVGFLLLVGLNVWVVLRRSQCGDAVGLGQGRASAAP